MFPTSSTAVPSSFEDYMREHNLSPDHATLENHRVLWQLERRVDDEAPTVIPACPSWCTQLAGHGYPSYNGALDGQPITYDRQHVAFQGEFLDVSATERNTEGVVSLDVPSGYLYGEKGDLTVEQVRAIAAEMTRAAEVLDAITSAARRCPRSLPHEAHTWPSMVEGEDWHCPGVGEL